MSSLENVENLKRNLVQIGAFWQKLMVLMIFTQVCEWKHCHNARQWCRYSGLLF